MLPPCRPVAVSASTLVLALVLANCEKRGNSEAPICDVNETRISDSTLGPLHIDERVGALRERCLAVGDTTLAQVGSAGSLPALRLTVRGAPIVILHDGNKVTSLRAESPFFRTNDSLGVGTSVAAFRNLHGIRVTKRSESPYAALIDRRRCGVTYELSGWGSPPPLTPTDPPVTGAALATWSDTIVVRGVTVGGCHGITRDLGVDSIAEMPADSLATESSPVPAAAPLDTTPNIPLPSELPKAAAPMAAVTSKVASIGSATARELSELSARLDVPVQGVTRPQLRDTYTEPRAGHSHEALDIPAARGTPVIAATDGRVLKLFDSKAGGLMVYTTDAADRFVLLYGHLDRYAAGLKDGTKLARGQVIGYVGTTGNAPPGTPHLHFAILRGDPKLTWWSGTPVNPFPLLVPPKSAP